VLGLNEGDDGIQQSHELSAHLSVDITNGLMCKTDRADPWRLSYETHVKASFANHGFPNLSKSRKFKFIIGCFDETVITSHIQSTANFWATKNRLESA